MINKILKTKQIPCKNCGKLMPYLSSKLCDKCWQLEHKYDSDLIFKRKIIIINKEKDSNMENYFDKN